jgi:hypothetical protein
MNLGVSESVRRRLATVAVAAVVAIASSTVVDAHGAKSGTDHGGGKSGAATTKTKVSGSTKTTLTSSTSTTTTTSTAAGAGTTSKTYTETINATSVYTGGTYGGATANSGYSAVQISVTNMTSPQSIGSVNIRVPSGFTILNSSGSPLTANCDTPLSVTGAGAGATACYTTGTLTAAGTTYTNVPVIALRTLGLAPNATAVVTFAARVACAVTSGDSVTWYSEVKQSNDFSGLPGNDFVITGGYPSSTFSGQCTLSITSPGPQDAENSSIITTVDFDTSGTSVTVDVLTGQGNTSNRVVWWTGEVDLTKVSGPTTTPAGNTANAVAGVATFGSFAISTSGNYTFHGVDGSGSPAGVIVTSANSALFTIYDMVQSCNGGPCTQLEPGARGSAQVSANTSAGGFVAVSLNTGSDPSTLCGVSTSGAGSDLVTFAVTQGTSLKTVKITIDRSFVTKAASKYDVCLALPHTFTTKSGGSATLVGSYYEGVLPDCTSSPSFQPCVSGRSVVGGNVVITFTTLASDPFSRAY